MSRVANAIMGSTTGFAAGHSAPMVNLQYGGQMGYAQELTEWVSNAAYVRKNVIPVLIEAPIGFNFLPGGQDLIGILRALVETQAMTIEGLNSGLTVDVATNPVGGAGEMQEDVTDVKRAQTRVTMRFAEKYGMPVFDFFQMWIQYLLMDPNTKYAAIGTLPNPPTDMLPDMYSATMLFIEPDPMMTRVVRSWLVTNMWPQGTGEASARRDITQANETTTYDITWSGIAQYSLGVDAFAQQILSAMSITGANPYFRAPFVDQIQADILATNKSFASTVSDVATQAIQV